MKLEDTGMPRKKSATTSRDASPPQSERTAPSTEPASPARSTASSVGGKKRKKEPLFLTELQEQDVAEWYRDNEVLYNKGKKDYKDSRLRMRLFAEKASSLNPPCTGEQLRTWIESMRTNVGKITKKKKKLKAKTQTSAASKFISAADNCICINSATLFGMYILSLQMLVAEQRNLNLSRVI